MEKSLWGQLLSIPCLGPQLGNLKTWDGGGSLDDQEFESCEVSLAHISGAWAGGTHEVSNRVLTLASSIEQTSSLPGCRRVIRLLKWLLRALK